jgi:hypothetical protein
MVMLEQRLNGEWREELGWEKVLLCSRQKQHRLRKE